MTNTFHHAEIAVLFAVFDPFGRAQELIARRITRAGAALHYKRWGRFDRRKPRIYRGGYISNP